MKKHVTNALAQAFCVCTPLLAADYCALRVHVHSPQGQPVVAAVALKVHNGDVSETKLTNAQGVVDFCDIGLGLVDIVVGMDLCGQVIVRNLLQMWPHTRDVWVIYESCHGNNPPSGCLLMIRVLSEDGKPLVGVSGISTNSNERFESDQYGRVFVWLRFGNLAHLRLSKKGFKDKSISFACDPRRVSVEEIVTLAR